MPLESNATTPSGTLFSIISLRRSSRISARSSSTIIFFLFLERWADRRFAARLASFLSSHSFIIAPTSAPPSVGSDELVHSPEVLAEEELTDISYSRAKSLDLKRFLPPLLLFFEDELSDLRFFASSE